MKRWLWLIALPFGSVAFAAMYLWHKRQSRWWDQYK